ncbi:hypothetical protein WDU94_005508 [Cyamophila willieti]
MIEHLLETPDQNNSISPITQLLLSLRFYAIGNFLITSGDFCGVSKSSACKIVRKVSHAIANLAPQFIRMPETEDQIRGAQVEFYKRARLPRIIGPIDCTHVKIESPGEAHQLYNVSLIRIRNPVERSYGVWKRRFPVLKHGMRLKLETCQAVTIATAVLHNIAIDENSALPPNEIPFQEEEKEEEEEEEEEPWEPLIPIEDDVFMNARESLLRNHFANMG